MSQLTPTDSHPGDDKETKSVDHIETTNSSGEELLVSHYATLSIHQALRKFWRLYLTGLLVSVAAMYLGFTLTIPGAVVANQGFINQFGSKHDAKGNLQIDAVHIGAWGGINLGSQVIFQGISPITAEKFGRKFNLYVLTLFIILAVILEIVAKNWVAFLMAKLVCGFAAGFIGTTVTTYTSEITIPQFRGSHLAAFSFSWGLGGLFAAIGMEVLQQTNPLAYKHAFYSEFVIIGVWLPVLFYLPESPVWLVKKGRDDKAKRSLRRLFGNVRGYDWDHEYAVLKQDVAESDAIAAKSSQHSFLACFKGTNLRRTLISTVPFSMQHYVGGPLMFNAPYFLQQIGMDNAFQSNLIISCVSVFTILVSFYLVDKAGRRPLLIIGALVMSVCCLIVGGMGVKGITKATGSATVAMMAIWVVAYSVSYGPIGWMTLVELSTPVLRTQTAGIAAILQSFSGVMFAYTYAGWGAKTGFFFGPLAFLCAVIVWFTIPVSKGRTYAEMDELFERRLPAWRFKNAKTSAQAAIAKEKEGVQGIKATPETQGA